MQFPWSAVVGQEALKQALILCAIDPAIGGVLVHGPRGVAKTTLARALAELVPGRFVELPLGATEERVTGTLNLERVLQDGRVEFAPGLLARAHDGVLYVDEVNLLPDALVDLLLDAAATGRNVVERDGVSHTHPARFVLVGSMNPEEGELRPQLIDRFGLAASAEGTIAPAARAEIVTRRLEFDRDPEAFRAAYAKQQAELVERCRRASIQAATIPMNGPALAKVTERCHAAGVEGVRADLAMLRAARAHAAWNDRAEITDEDVDAVAELALAHRVPSGPSESGGGRGGGPAASGGERFGGGARSAGSNAPRGQLGAADTAEGGERPQADEGRGLGGDAAATSPESAPAADGRGAASSSAAASRGAAGGVAGSRSGGAMPARVVQSAAIPALPQWLQASRGRGPGRYRRGKSSVRSASGARGRASTQVGVIDWFATLRDASLSCSSSRAPRAGDARSKARGISASAAREFSQTGDAGAKRPHDLSNSPEHLAAGPDADPPNRKLCFVAGESLRTSKHAPSRAAEGDLSTRGANDAGDARSFATARSLRLGPDALRYREWRKPSALLWIVAVDCSSSMLRSGGLAVAKGVAHAVERSAARAGARLAVLSFRGSGAQLEVDSSPGRAVIPQAIAALGGGGGTPLRAALSAARTLCHQTRWRSANIWKRLLVLTDGRVREVPAATTLPDDLERVVIDCERGRVRLNRARDVGDALRADYWRPD